MSSECPKCGGVLVYDGLRESCPDCGHVVRVSEKVLAARRRSNRTTYIAVSLGAVAVVGLLVWQLLDPVPDGGVVEGTLELKGGALGQARFAPTECIAAERIVGLRFAGVALLGRQPHTQMIRVVRHVHHPGAMIREDLAREVVIASRPSPRDPWQAITLTPQTCPGLVVELEPFSAWWFAESAAERNARYQGSIKADCALADGGRVAMSIHFEHCHRNPHMEKRAVK